MRTVTLTPNEIALLDQEPIGMESDVGFRNLIVDLQGRVNRQTNNITLCDSHEQKIARYAFHYQNGRWRERLIGVFGRTMGAQLGR